MVRIGRLALACVLGFWPVAEGAQERPAAKLAHVTSAKCTFSAVAVGSWNTASPTASVRPSTLKFSFDNINVDEGSAQVIGPFGPSDIIVQLSLGTLHIMQSFRDGPLYITTIFPQRTAAGALKAVHTRHEYTDVALIGFTSSPEQYYGDCEVID